MSGIRATPVVTFLVAIFAGIISAQTPQDLWLMKARDARRSGQSRINGPREREVDANQSWSVQVPAAFVINVGASVSESGVFFGSWGLLRFDDQGRGDHFWDKMDGKVYGHDLDGRPLWHDGSLKLDLTPYKYDYGQRFEPGAHQAIWNGRDDAGR